MYKAINSWENKFFLDFMKKYRQFWKYYYSYLKLLTLILLKIEDDLLISQMIEKVGD
jgi:hypothetical protein